jgi:hypothetical protein
MKNKDDNYISVGGWMLLMFVTAIPIIGLILVIVLAFVGSNETRKNYYRAIIAWVLLLLLATICLFVFASGTLPDLQQHLRNWQIRH